MFGYKWMGLVSGLFILVNSLAQNNKLSAPLDTILATFSLPGDDKWIYGRPYKVYEKFAKNYWHSIQFSDKKQSVSNIDSTQFKSNFTSKENIFASIFLREPLLHSNCRAQLLDGFKPKDIKKRNLAGSSSRQKLLMLVQVNNQYAIIKQVTFSSKRGNNWQDVTPSEYNAEVFLSEPIITSNHFLAPIEDVLVGDLALYVKKSGSYKIRITLFPDIKPNDLFLADTWHSPIASGEFTYEIDEDEYYKLWLRWCEKKLGTELSFDKSLDCYSDTIRKHLSLINPHIKLITLLSGKMEFLPLKSYEGDILYHKVIYAVVDVGKGKNEIEEEWIKEKTDRDPLFNILYQTKHETHAIAAFVLRKSPDSGMKIEVVKRGNPLFAFQFQIPNNYVQLLSGKK